MASIARGRSPCIPGEPAKTYVQLKTKHLKFNGHITFRPPGACTIFYIVTCYIATQIVIGGGGGGGHKKHWGAETE